MKKEVHSTLEHLISMVFLKMSINRTELGRQRAGRGAGCGIMVSSFGHHDHHFDLKPYIFNLVVEFKKV